MHSNVSALGVYTSASRRLHSCCYQFWPYSTSLGRTCFCLRVGAIEVSFLFSSTNAVCTNEFGTRRCFVQGLQTYRRPAPAPRELPFRRHCPSLEARERPSFQKYEYDYQSRVIMRCLNSFFEWFYGRYAYVVYRHAWLFIILPVAATACFSVGFLLMNDRMLNDTTYLFTPINGRHRYEKAVVLEHWPMDQDNFVAGLSPDARHWLYIVVRPKNRTRGLWNNETLDEILTLIAYINTNFTLQTVDGSKDFDYSDVCLTYRRACFGNGHVLALRAQDIIVANGGPRITFPISREYLTDDPSYLGFMLGQATVNETDGTLLNVNAIRLAYFTKRFPVETDTMSIQWRIGIQKYLLSYRSDLISLSFWNEDSANQGLMENAVHYAPQIAVTFALMLAFTFMNSFVVLQKRGFVGIDWVRSKPLLAIFGVSEPGLAVASTIGLMLLFGAPYYPVLVAMPFLVFGK